MICIYTMQTSQSDLMNEEETLLILGDDKDMYYDDSIIYFNNLSIQSKGIYQNPYFCLQSNDSQQFLSNHIFSQEQKAQEQNKSPKFEDSSNYRYPANNQRNKNMQKKRKPRKSHKRQNLSAQKSKIKTKQLYKVKIEDFWSYKIISTYKL